MKRFHYYQQLVIMKSLRIQRLVRPLTTVNEQKVYCNNSQRHVIHVRTMSSGSACVRCSRNERASVLPASSYLSLLGTFVLRTPDLLDFNHRLGIPGSAYLGPYVFTYSVHGWCVIMLHGLIGDAVW